MKIQLHAKRDGITKLGPGTRFVVWTQGCPRSCPGCMTAASQQMNGGFSADTKQLAEEILQSGRHGLTISGGEPFLQAKALADLIQEVRKKTDLGVMIYTGFTLEELQEADNPDYNLLDDRKIGLLDRKIRQAGDDVKGGQYQSAITAGREAFYGAMDMKEELALAALEWNYQYNSVRTRERQLLEALEEAEQRVYEIDTEEGTYQYNNGIDYWTFGQLTILRNQIATVRASLEHAGEMKLPQLQEAEEELHSLQEQLLLLENAAHINVAMSVSRYETASKIGAILDDNYEMMDADGEFFAREDREEYHALFQNPVTRDQVAVVITPIPDEGGVVTNHIELIVGNADNNPVTRDRIAQEVAEKLRSAGLEGCSFSACSGRYGDRTPQEVARVSDMTAVERGDEKVRATKPVGAVQTDAVTSRVRRTQKTPVTSAK